MNQLFNALADPTRLDIVELLAAKGQMPATDIYKKFSVSHPAISQHLKVLREADLVKVEKQAQQRLYQINLSKISEIERWTAEMKKVWEPRLQKLEKILAKNKRGVKQI